MNTTTKTIAAGAIALAALGTASCSSSTKSSTDATLPGGASVSSIAQTQADCKSIVTSGQPVTADDITTCKNSNITVSQTCTDNTTIIYEIPVDQIEWVLIEGKAAVKLPSTDTNLRTYCPA